MPISPYLNHADINMIRLLSDKIMSEEIQALLQPKDSDPAAEKKARETSVAKEAIRRLICEPRYADSVGMSMSNLLEEARTGSMKDAISFEELRQFIPAVISEVVNEAQEPGAVLTRLLSVVPVDKSLAVIFPSFGGMEDAEEVGPNQEYPVRSIGMAGTAMTRISKVGLRLQFAKEVLEASKGFAFMQYVMNAAGRAMVRTKEKKAAAHIAALATTIFDNASTSFLNTSGVGLNGSQNGTYLIGDLVYQMGLLIDQGFTPDTVMIHGLGWTVFAQTPELKEILGFRGGSQFKWPQGQGGALEEGRKNPMGLWTAASGLAGTLVNPSQELGRPITTVVSPYISHTPAGGSNPALVDIVVADSKYVGALLQSSPVQSESWNDPSRDLQNTKLFEEYAIAPLAEGRGINIARNVALKRGLDPFANFSFASNDVPDAPDMPPTAGTAIFS